MVKKITVFITILGLFFVGIPRFNVKAQTQEVDNLAISNLENKEYLGNGVYLINNNHGVTLTYNVYNGIWTLNGTTTDIISTHSFSMDVTIEDGVFSATYIRLRGTNTSTDNNVHIRLSSSPIVINIGLNQDNQVLNGYQINEAVSLYIRLVNNVTFDNLQFRLQIELGDTVTPYQIPINAIRIHSHLEYQRGYNNGLQLDNEEAYDAGYDAGFDAGENYGYFNGYDDGWAEAFVQGTEEGWQEGYYYGYNKGLTETDATGFNTLLITIFGGLGALLGIEILPGIYIGAIIAVPLVFGIIFFILGKRKGD